MRSTWRVQNTQSGEHVSDVIVVQVVIELHLYVELFEEAHGFLVLVLLQCAQSTHSAGDTLVTFIRTTNSYKLFS